MQDAFARRILAERTRALAARGVASEARLSPSLVCHDGGRLVALPMALVASIRPFGCQPVPLVGARAAGTMLGVSLYGHRLVSVLDLGRLLAGGADTDATSGPIADPASSGGKMILLRLEEPVVALRVQRVLGVMRLVASLDPDRALMPSADVPADRPDLVSLVSADRLVALIAALDNG